VESHEEGQFLGIPAELRGGYDEERTEERGTRPRTPELVRREGGLGSIEGPPKRHSPHAHFWQLVPPRVNGHAGVPSLHRD